MKPTHQQKQWLHDYLYQVMKYRETYEEVYDHVLTALENKPEQHFFEGTVNEIIAEDFGAPNGLSELEEGAKKVVGKEVIKQYRVCFYSFFKFPGVIYTLSIPVVIFYVNKVTHFFMSLLVIFLLLAPFLLIPIKAFITSYKTGKTKTSLRDRVFRMVIFKPVAYFLRFIFFTTVISVILRNVFHYNPQTTQVLDTGGYCILMIIITALIIHYLCCFKLYKEEFKTTPVPKY